MNQQAFITGFTKRAMEYGLSKNDATELLKESGIMDNISDFFHGRLMSDMHFPSHNNMGSPSPTPMPSASPIPMPTATPPILGAVGNDLGQNLSARNNLIQQLSNSGQ